MRKIAVIGAGGIGSYLVHLLCDLKKANQLDDTEIVVFDDDVVEEKNIVYQNFEPKDIMEFKATVLEEKFPIIGVNERVTDTNALKNMDLIVICIDNSAGRKLIFDYTYKHEDVSFIDLRAEGRTIGCFVKESNTHDYMLDTLPDTEGDASCQLPFELKNNIIQQGNKIAAAIGSQLVLNWHRDITGMGKLIVNI